MLIGNNQFLAIQDMDIEFMNSANMFPIIVKYNKFRKYNKLLIPSPAGDSKDSFCENT